MSPSGSIRAERLWKRFRADRRRTLLRDELQRLAARLRGGANRGWRWALRDVDLVADPGESIGLVGANGSGKSTLLKLLARVMVPYAGRVEIGGRVGALIEVRAGIHPDLSGRENIRLYGSLLGLGRRQVAARFDEIVAFAELERAIDRQVKFYSSGMQMRLGFAIAAFLEPDVLLVDEVLAVGDASFQQKCLQRMREVLAQGTTLVFVSHDLAAVEAMCRRGVWLADGVVQADGPVREVLSAYRSHIEADAMVASAVDGAVRLVRVALDGGGRPMARTEAPLAVTLGVRSHVRRRARLALGVSEGTAAPVFLVARDIVLEEGETTIGCTVERLPLPAGRYSLWASLTDPAGEDLLAWRPLAHFEVVGAELDRAPAGIVRLAPVHVSARWHEARPGDGQERRTLSGGAVGRGGRS